MLQLTESRSFLVRALLGALSLSPGSEAGGDGPAGKLLHVAGKRLDLAVFQSDQPIRSEEIPKPATVFDQDQLPSALRSCHVEQWRNRDLKIVRPLDRASFPRNIAPPRFRWEDQTSNAWKLSLSAPGWSAPLQVVTRERAWRPDEAIWEAVKASGTGDWIELEVRGCLVSGGRRAGAEVYADRIKFRVSEYPADPVVVYRLVSPLFHGFKTPDIYYRDLRTFETGMFLPSKTSYCTNCHVFPAKPMARKNELTLAVAVRKSFEGLRLLGLYEFDSRKGENLVTNTFFMSWGPEGKKLAVTAGRHVAIRPPITLETQEFYVRVADLVIVDKDTLEVRPLPGAAEPDYMETLPAWSPDGKTIVFARAKEFEKLPFKVRYDLYRVPYNNGEGGQAEPVKGASHNGKSNFAPRFSPDGKWLVFNMGESGSLVEPTADLWIMSTEAGATPRELECNSPYSMDSHHSWSSNSRWLLFAAKPDDGIFARIYFTEIDEDGRASPPVELPILEDPMMCFNVPEFLQRKPDIDAEDILRKVSTPKE